MHLLNASKSISVLLIEDNRPDAYYVQTLLPADVFNVVHVSTLGEAERKISEGFDVLLLDLSLPDTDGDAMSTFRAALAMAKKTPIIILTGLDDETIAVDAVQNGAQDFIRKRDVSEDTLLRSIRYSIERRKSEENMSRLAVYEQREEFMATLTHDLKNPLIGANRILELMAARAMGDVSLQQEKILLQLRDSNKTLLSIVQNLIEVYRFERGVNTVCMQRTDLLEVLSSCIADIAPIAENREIELLKNCPGESIVFADPNSMRRVMQNLLDNALKFTPRGGRVTMDLAPRSENVVLEIGDTGPGIPPDDQLTLFQRFSQGRVGKKYTPGTGLGLYLCKQIVDAHRGEISFTTAEGVGTTFKVLLPAAASY